MSIIADLAKFIVQFERLRKPISLIVACALMAGVLTGVPRGFRSIPYEGIEFLGMMLLGCAAMGRIWCLLYIAGRKNEVLCQSGPYSLSRNPLYLFSFIGVVGFFLAAQSVIFAGLAALLFLAYYHGVILSEEARLQALFGADFMAYKADTPRFWPSHLRIQRVDQIMIKPKIIERGLCEVVWFLMAIVLADVIECLHRNEYLRYFTLPF